MRSREGETSEATSLPDLHTLVKHLSPQNWGPLGVHGQDYYDLSGLIQKNSAVLSLISLNFSPVNHILSSDNQTALSVILSVLYTIQSHIPDQSSDYHSSVWPPWRTMTDLPGGGLRSLNTQKSFQITGTSCSRLLLSRRTGLVMGRRPLRLRELPLLSNVL